jgi:hypothetical protein
LGDDHLSRLFNFTGAEVDPIVRPRHLAELGDRGVGTVDLMHIETPVRSA